MGCDPVSLGSSPKPLTKFKVIMSNYIVSERYIELEEENMEFHIERLRKHVVKNRKTIIEETDKVLKILKDKGIKLA